MPTDDSRTVTKMRVDTLLIEALHEYMDSWNNPAVWSRIWSEIAEEASKEGINAFEARKVARRLFDQLKEELNVKQAEIERKERQKDALALWVKNLDISDQGAEWNYDMWDEFLETLDAPVDMSYLEQTRDALIKEAIIELQEKTDKAVEKWALGLTVTPEGVLEFAPFVVKDWVRNFRGGIKALMPSFNKRLVTFHSS